MGIYVQSFADLPSRAPNGDWPAHVADVARDWAASRGLGDQFYASVDETSAWISFYPPSGGISFQIANGRLSFDAKTSIGGPGFHAALIDLCDRLQHDLALVWRWDAGGDETGFARTRDRAALTEQFRDQFFGFCERYRADSDARAFALNLAEDLALASTTGIATPMGERTRTFFLDAADGGDPDAAAAREVFPWWDDALDADFWNHTLRALIWAEVEWRRPQGPWEAFIHNACLHAFDEATRLGVAIDEAFAHAIAELKAIQQRNDSDFAPPRTDLPGYKRRSRGYFLPGNWRVAMPGYYIDRLENDATATCIWFGNEEVRGSSFTVHLKEPGKWDWGERFASALEFNAGTHRFRVDPAIKPTSDGWGWIGFANCVAFPTPSTAELLIVSLTAKHQDDMAERLHNICRDVWLQSSQALPKAAKDA